MKKETTNRLRFIIEDVLPPFARDSAAFRLLATKLWGDSVVRLADFRKRSTYVTDQEYEDLYKGLPQMHEHGDNTTWTNDELIENIVGETVCDVGCGGGSLLQEIQKRRPGLTRLVGVDFAFDQAQDIPGIEFVASKIERLPFEDNEFDTVVCTHVIEHILEYRTAIAELRRIARHRLIVVTPREREGIYTFNAHLNFFPYPHSLLRAMHPSPAVHRCVDIRRDLYYQEDVDIVVGVSSQTG